MSLTRVVSARSVVVVIRSDMSSGESPPYCQTMLITGMSISGKISVGGRRMTMGLRIRINSAITTKVYGLRKGRATIHMTYSVAPVRGTIATQRGFWVGYDGLSSIDEIRAVS